MGDFYTKSGAPTNGASLSSSAIRAEFALIEAGFDKFPALTGNGSKFLRVNSGATAVEALSAADAMTALLAAGVVTSSAAELNIMDGVLATAAEINSACDGATSGSFTGTVTGLDTIPTGTIYYKVSGGVVTLFIPSIIGTSNATTMTITGMPAGIRPSAQQVANCTYARDNGGTVVCTLTVATNGTLTYGVIDDVFTNTGSKGTVATTISYLISN